MKKIVRYQSSRKAKPHPYTGRQSKRDLEAWVFTLQMMIGEIVHSWPAKQQIAVLDGLLQAIVQRLNYLRDREKMLP